MNKSYKTYQHNNVSKFRKLSKSEPKRFWKLLKTKNTNHVNAPLKDVFAHFKKLNSNVSTNNDDDVNLRNENNLDIDNSVLNSEISLEEVEKAVFSLKNNKACGSDTIVNEHIKHSFPAM